jgi:hypothetical protein
MEQAKKMNMKDKYNAMTGDLAWDFTYKTEAEIFPLSDFEMLTGNIKVRKNASCMQ